MNRSFAKKMKSIIPNEDIKLMLENAITNVPDWTKQSRSNKSFSRGHAWNTFCKDFDVNKDYSKYGNLMIYRMILEFGEYLPEKYVPKKKPKPKIDVHHEDPIFLWFK